MLNSNHIEELISKNNIFIDIISKSYDEIIKIRNNLCDNEKFYHIEIILKNNKECIYGIKLYKNKEDLLNDVSIINFNIDTDILMKIINSRISMKKENIYESYPGFQLELKNKGIYYKIQNKFIVIDEELKYNKIEIC
jgi:hypothetical protein